MTEPPGRPVRPIAEGLLRHATAALVGRGFGTALRDMQRAEWLPADALRARSEARLSVLLGHAARNVPFYRDAYRRLGLEWDSLRTVGDLAALPVMTKTDYRAETETRFLAENVTAHRRIDRRTSGSTGEPLRFVNDRDSLPVTIAGHVFYDRSAGIGPLDRWVSIDNSSRDQPRPPAGAPAGVRFRHSVSEGARRLYEELTQRRISVWEVDATRAAQIWRQIEAFRPNFVWGYTSTLAALADEWLRHDLRVGGTLRGVVTIAETLTADRRRLIERAFGAPITNRYGLLEFGTWSAQSCPVDPERLHLNTELVVGEVLDEGGTPVAPGETGRLVLTDLHNYARPFIRYFTGDLVVAGAGPCPCGRGFPLIGPLDGRAQETLRTPSGKVFSPVVLEVFLFRRKSYWDVLSHYQLVHEAPDRARMLVVPGPGFDEGLRERLRDDLVELLGDEVQVAVETVEAIPMSPSGKRAVIKVEHAEAPTRGGRA